MSPHALQNENQGDLAYDTPQTNVINGKGGITLKAIPRFQHICYDHSYMRYS
eukprot:jgi/Botrbrau1/1666/Bobra.116_2s0010.1